MKTYAVFTHFVEGAADKRAPHREAHLAHLRELHEKGVLILGGALQNPVPNDGAAGRASAPYAPNPLDRGLLVIRAESPEAIEELLAEDSYAKNGIWTRIEIREWTVVVGDVGAAS